MDENKLYLGFDYGTSNIGVAVGQLITRSANVLPPLLTRRLHLPWEDLDRLIEHWKPAALIVGLPHTFDGEEFPVTKLARRFMQLLEQRYQLPVYGIEELLTTKEARAALFERGGYRALHTNSVDSMAAKLILESWMNQ